MDDPADKSGPTPYKKHNKGDWNLRPNFGIPKMRDSEGPRVITALALPTCRNYWRLTTELPSVHRHNGEEMSTGSSKYSKGKKRRHLDSFDEPSDFRYRIRDPFNPSPFRGCAMIIFWTLFALILLFIGVMICAVLYVGMTQDQRHADPGHMDKDQRIISSSIILSTLFKTRQYS